MLWPTFVTNEPSFSSKSNPPQLDQFRDPNKEKRKGAQKKFITLSIIILADSTYIILKVFFFFSFIFLTNFRRVNVIKVWKHRIVTASPTARLFITFYFRSINDELKKKSENSKQERNEKESLKRKRKKKEEQGIYICVLKCNNVLFQCDSYGLHRLMTIISLLFIYYFIKFVGPSKIQRLGLQALKKKKKCQSRLFKL